MQQVTDLVNMSKSTLTKALVTYFKNNGIQVSNSLATNVVESVFQHIVESLQTAGRFAYPGFGTFKVKVRAARSGINALTKKEFKTPEMKVVRFSQTKGTDSFFADLQKAALFKRPAPAGAAAKKVPAKKAAAKQ